MLTVPVLRNSGCRPCLSVINHSEIQFTKQVVRAPDGKGKEQLRQVQDEWFTSTSFGWGLYLAQRVGKSLHFSSSSICSRVQGHISQPPSCWLLRRCCGADSSMHQRKGHAGHRQPTGCPMGKFTLALSSESQSLVVWECLDLYYQKYLQS